MKSGGMQDGKIGHWPQHMCCASIQAEPHISEDREQKGGDLEGGG